MHAPVSFCRGILSAVDAMCLGREGGAAGVSEKVR